MNIFLKSIRFLDTQSEKPIATRQVLMRGSYSRRSQRRWDPPYQPEDLRAVAGDPVRRGSLDVIDPASDHLEILMVMHAFLSGLCRPHRRGL